jgi:hypothetical protein
MVSGLSRLLAVSAACVLLSTAACRGEPAGIPPSEPTHHAIVEGVVLRADGQALGSVGVGALFAESSPPRRQASVTGGGTTDADGAYRFQLRAGSRKLRGVATIDIYVRALKAGPPGGQAVTDSVLATLQVVPLSDPPRTTRVSEIRLPVQ